MAWSVVGAHVAAIVHGVSAAVACAALFYVCGAALLPSSMRDRSEHGETPALLGVAAYALVCWFGVTSFGVPVIVLAPAYAAGVLALAVVRWRVIAVDLGRLGPVAWPWVALFAGFYVLMYLFTLQPVTGEYLPPAWLGNIDLVTYARFSQYVLRLGPSNLAAYPEFSYLGFVYLQTPAVFQLQAGFSFFFGLDFLQAAMPAAFALAALTGVLAVRMTRSIFGLSPTAAVTVGAVLLCGPFYRYVFGQYFLSTLMSTPVALLLAWMTLASRPSRRLDAGLALRWAGAYVLLLFLYPLLLAVGIAAQAAAVLLLFLAEAQGDGRGSDWSGARRTTARRAVAMAAALGVVAVTLFARVVWAIDEVMILSQPNINGWPLDLISPLAILGVPAAWTNLEKCRFCMDLEVVGSAARIWSAGFVVALGLVLSGLYYGPLARKTSPQQRALAVMGGGALAGYLAFYLLSGPSYQQWKFASYTALPWSFAAVAGVAHAVRLSTSARFHRLRAALPAFALVLIGGNIVAHAQAGPGLTQFPVGLANIAALDTQQGFREISVMMDETFDGLSSWLSLFLLPDKQVHVISRRNVPHEELSYDTISPQRPLLRQNFGCEGIGHADTQDVPEVGCLLFAPPSLVVDEPYPFNQTYWFVSFTGLGAREPEGRWNTDRAVSLTLMADVKRAPLFDDRFVNLRVTPYLPPGTSGQRLLLAWGKGKHAETVITSTRTVTLPVSRSDWDGVRIWTLPVSVELPDRLPPHWMYAPRGHADGPPLAALFEEISVTRVPKGDLLNLSSSVEER